MSTRIGSAVAAIAGLVLLAGPAFAGSIIVTPVLGPPPAGGSVRCNIVNASASKTVDYTLRIFDVTGTLLQEDEQELFPGETSGHHSNGGLAAYCAVELTKGSKKDLRVSFIVYTSHGGSGEIQAAVSGQ